jgi:hypothetical protein
VKILHQAGIATWRRSPQKGGEERRHGGLVWPVTPRETREFCLTGAFDKSAVNVVFPEVTISNRGLEGREIEGHARYILSQRYGSLGRQLAFANTTGPLFCGWLCIELDRSGNFVKRLAVSHRCNPELMIVIRQRVRQKAISQPETVGRRNTDRIGVCGWVWRQAARGSEAQRSR